MIGKLSRDNNATRVTDLAIENLNLPFPCAHPFLCCAAFSVNTNYPLLYNSELELDSTISIELLNAHEAIWFSNHVFAEPHETSREVIF
jgi:hypothetical protein